MKILVTGAGGFIGGAMLRYLRSNYPDAELVGVLRQPAAIASMPDIRTTTTIEAADVLVHLAGNGGIPESVNDPTRAFEGSCQGATDTLNMARRTGIGMFVMVSTCAVYPWGPKPAKEYGPLSLDTPYAQAKRTAEIYCETAAKLTDLGVRIVRLANIFGPYQKRQMIYDVARRAIQNDGPLELLSSGEERRDFLHVKDAARAIWTVIENGNTGEIYNIGSGNPVSVRNVAGLIADTFQRTVVAPDDNARDGEKDAFPDVRRLQSLGFTPDYTIESGLKETLNWIVKNL